MTNDAGDERTLAPRAFLNIERRTLNLKRAVESSTLFGFWQDSVFLTRRAQGHEGFSGERASLQSSKNLSLCRPPPCRPDFMKFHVFHGSAFTLQRSAFGGEAHQVRK
jgi:hypothetical protein